MSIHLNRHEVKLTVFGSWLNKINPQTCFLNLKKSNLTKKPVKSTVFHWYKQFNEGSFMFKDLPRGRPPSKSVNVSNISKIKVNLDKERRVTVRKLAAVSEIPKSSVHRILSKKLQVEKLKAIRIPHKLTKKERKDRILIAEDMLAQMRSNLPDSLDEIVTGDETYLYFEPVYMGHERQWTYKNEETPKQPKFQTLTHKKRMFFIFFNRNGDYHVDYQPENEAANATNYCNQLEKVQEKFGPKIVLHDDNCPIHTCNETLEFRISNLMPRLGHPPYSPDLAPCDFWLIRIIKKELIGHVYKTAEYLLEEVKRILDSIPKEHFERCFDEWMVRLMKCIDAEGEYIEYRKRDLKNK